MEAIMDLAGKHPELLRTLGRFAGMLYGRDTNDFAKALRIVEQELKGNLANLANTLRGAAHPSMA
jgi:hypothetical protein